MREHEAGDYVFGVTCVNDVTARELQNKGGGLHAGEGVRHVRPARPVHRAGLDELDPGDLAVEGWVNGERRQSSSTRQLIFPLPMLIAYISANMTLLPGDVIATGTPSGIGPLTAGDPVTIQVAGVGALTNPVRNQIMKLFIDSGNLKEIESLVPLGIIDGVTTNPSLLAKEPGDSREILKKICQIVKGPMSAEVVATDADGMIREGRELATIDEHIVVKVPFTREGVQRVQGRSSSEGKRVNVTLIFSPTQALLAAKVGATYVSPFVGRLDDIATSGMGLISDIVEIFENYQFTTEILVATTRGPMHIVEAARLGADICTCPAAVIEALFKHPLTDIGLEKFLKDWEKAQAAQGLAAARGRTDDTEWTRSSTSKSSSAARSSAAARTA